MTDLELAREVVAQLCTDDPCAIVDARSCGCCESIMKALASARAEAEARIGELEAQQIDWPVLGTLAKENDALRARLEATKKALAELLECELLGDDDKPGCPTERLLAAREAARSFAI